MHRSYRAIAIGTPSAPHGRMATIAPLVAPAWLEEHIDDPDLRIVDATVQITPELQITSGREDWRKEHIPRSTFADLLELSSPDAPPFTFTWPEPDWFASHMGQLGVGEGTRVVLYDRRENMWAARLWWMLRAFGFEDAAVLDGGWTSWKLEKRRTCEQPCSYPPATFLARPREGLIVRKHEVLAAIGDPKTSIVDALGRKSHTGEVNEYGRPGHIPGARNVSAWRIIDRASQRYRPVDELRALFGNVLGAERIITYCGAGAAGASDAFALSLLGHPHVALYPGGMLEWSADPSLPLEIGETVTDRSQVQRELPHATR